MEDYSKYDSKLCVDGGFLWTTTNGHLSCFPLKKPVKSRFCYSKQLVRRNAYVGLDPVLTYEVINEFIFYSPAANLRQLRIVHHKSLWKKLLKT